MGRGTLVALAIDVNHDTAGKPLDARHGYLASLHLEQASPIVGGDWSYFEATADGRLYIPVGRSVVALKARVGGIRRSEPACPSSSATSSADRRRCAAGDASRSARCSTAR